MEWKILEFFSLFFCALSKSSNQQQHNTVQNRKLCRFSDKTKLETSLHKIILDTIFKGNKHRIASREMKNKKTLIMFLVWFLFLLDDDDCDRETSLVHSLHLASLLSLITLLYSPLRNDNPMKLKRLKKAFFVFDDCHKLSSLWLCTSLSNFTITMPCSFVLWVVLWFLQEFCVVFWQWENNFHSSNSM